jgi:hypothetical protein
MRNGQTLSPLALLGKRVVTDIFKWTTALFFNTTQRRGLREASYEGTA